MTLDELKDRLQRLAWRRQVDFEASERGAPSEEDAIERELRALGRAITPALLDALERDGGYPAWVLQLSPHVSGDDSHARACRLAGDRSAEVRYWADQLLGQP